jgi:lipid II:glycine glycyltransferase (peptidoglycan interpeptide bridge formation enzyme)
VCEFFSSFEGFYFRRKSVIKTGVKITVTPKPVIEKESTPLVQQTSYWAMVKQKLGCESMVFDIHLIEQPTEKKTDFLNHQTNDDMLIVLRPVSNKAQIAYVPYGPNLLPEYEDRGTFLEELSEMIRPFLPSECLMIRYDLAWQSPWADKFQYTDKNGREGPPEPRIQEMRMNFATKNFNLRKAPTDILPTNTIFMNLQKDKDTLLRRMKPKTRYNIHLACRRGVNVCEADHNNLKVWYELYKETAQRNRIVLPDIEYFRAVLRTRASDSLSPAQVHLLLAEESGDVLAGMFLVITEKRATYLYGASSSKKRNLMPAYALQWKAIERAKKSGCNEYDMFGISPTADPSHPMYGLYRFKSGFGGEIFHRQGCWDYPLDEPLYEKFRIAEMRSQGFHQY